MSVAPVGRSGPTPTEWLLLGLGAVAFAPALLELAGVWRRTDYLTHAFMVPVVAGFLAAARRDGWRALEARRDPRGLLAVAIAGFATTAGLLADLPSLVGVGVVLAVVGAVWTLRGVPALRVMAFPLAFLVFMIPPPASWIGPLVLKLQLWVSIAAVELLRLGGLAILRDGNVIVVPSGGSLFVDEACSGITSVVTLVPLGVLLAWTTERTAWRRAVLLAFVVPAAMFGNLVRVTGTVFAASHAGVAAATSGFLHDWAGVLTYAMACGALLVVSWALSTFAPESPPSGAAA